MLCRHVYMYTNTLSLTHLLCAFSGVRMSGQFSTIYNTCRTPRVDSTDGREGERKDKNKRHTWPALYL